MPRPLLVAVRHGRTSWNALGRFQGWADPPLDAEGRRQAAECATALAELRVSGGTRLPAKVLSSDLRRAAETARAVGTALRADVTTDPDLREVDVGHWEGLTRTEVAERFPEELDMWTAGQDIRRGGETLTEAGTRVARVIADALLGEGLLIVVGHGMSLRAALEMLAEQRLVNLGGPAPHLGNGCHVVAEITEHATTVVSRPSV